MRSIHTCTSISLILFKVAPGQDRPRRLFPGKLVPEQGYCRSRSTLEIIPGQGRSQASKVVREQGRSRSRLTLEVVPEGEVRGPSQGRVIGRSRGRSTPWERSEVDLEGRVISHSQGRSIPGERSIAGQCHRSFLGKVNPSGLVSGRSHKLFPRPRKVNPKGEVRGRSQGRVIGHSQGRSIPGKRSDVDPEEGSGSGVNPGIFLLPSHLIPGIAVTPLSKVKIPLSIEII